MAEVRSTEVCCTTPGALCFWFALFLVLGGGVILLQQVIPGLQPYSGALLFAAAGVACLANFARNRTFHCVITGPLFLLVGGYLALRTAGIWEAQLPALWAIVLIVVGLALLLEQRFAH